MKRPFLFAAAALVSLLSAGCFSVQKNVGVPDKIIVLPAEKNQKSQPASGFITIGGRWASEQTEFTAERTNDGIKFEIICHGNTKKLEWSAKKTDDDMTLFSGEHVELLIAPEGIRNNGVYYHFSINPAGSMYHAKKRDTTWSPNVKPEIDIKENKWIARLEIPFSLITPLKENEITPDTIWNINVGRMVKKIGKAADNSSWTGSGNFHDILSMGQLHFSGKCPEDQLLIYQCGIDDQGKLELDVSKTGKKHAYLQIFDDNKLSTVLKMNGTERIKQTIPLKNNYIPLKGNKILSLYLLGPYRVPVQKISGTMLSADAKFLNLDKMEYINKTELTCKVDLVPGKAVIKNDKEAFLEQNISEKVSKLPLTGLKPGRYILEYTSHGKRSSRVFFVVQGNLPEFPALPEKGKLSISGTDLTLDGKPFYLLGISGGSKTYFPVPAGFTLQYGAGYRKNALPYSGVPGRRFVRKPATGYAFQKNWESTVRNHFEKMKKAEKPVWKTLCYEANMDVLFYNDAGVLEVDPKGHRIYRKIYDIAKDTIPNTPIAIHIDKIDKIENYVDCCDILEYAIWSSSYHRICMIQNFGRDFDLIRNRAEGKVLIPWLGGSIPNPTARSAEEIRAGVFYTILKGGAGNIIHMGHGGIPQHRTRFWSMLSMLTRDVESFYADLKTWKEINVELPKNLIGKTVISPDGEILSVMLNTTGIELKEKIKLPGFEEETLIFTPYEPRVIRKQKKIKEKKEIKEAKEKK